MKLARVYSRLLVLLLSYSALAVLAGEDTGALPEPQITQSDQVQVSESATQDDGQRGKPKWLILSYVVCDYKLHYLLLNNIKQMARVGSNENVTIIVQVHEHDPKRPTQRYLIERGRAVLLNPEDFAAGKRLDGGSAETLRDFIVTSVKQYPADHVCVVLSDHGSGIIDPIAPKIVDPNQLYEFDPAELLLELKYDFNYIHQLENNSDRGICFDPAFGTYLTYEKLGKAFREAHAITGKKITMVGMDACLMQMWEVGQLLRHCGTNRDIVDIVVASQEVEPGPGWDYEMVLSPFKERSLSPEEFARHIIKCYDVTYSQVAKDYTLSAVSLRNMQFLEENIHAVAKLLTAAMGNAEAAPLARAIKLARDRYNITFFYEESYIDLGHFYKNLMKFCEKAALKSAAALAIRADLMGLLREGVRLIESMVLANTVGKKRANAMGLSIYFPTIGIHPSYYGTYIAMRNHWIKFLEQYTHDRDVH